jgi:intracellular sulfur oxidation DsrE/DsrF family protein
MKPMRLFLVFSLLLTMGLTSRVHAQTQPAHRIIMQLSTNDTLAWKGLMNNLRNLKAGWGDSLTICVVAHGPGLDLLTAGKTTQAEKIRQFRQMGIEFIACENTMKERQIPRESILPDAGFVKMGIAEIVRRQEQGWTYIKAGF